VDQTARNKLKLLNSRNANARRCVYMTSDYSPLLLHRYMDLLPLKRDSYLDLTKVYYHTSLGSARYVLHLQKTMRVTTAYGATHVAKTG
jgi:hypothetical protein